ncbi:hypothetical protein SUGI_0775840 [Cryptomeria japonica]|nr:hypothetical protein SUGI_0775840 [Cryptomeria japonica]
MDSPLRLRISLCITMASLCAAGYLRCQKAFQKISTPITELEISSGYNSVNLERGYNLPMSVKSCGHQECSAPVASVCPINLQVKVNNEVVACQGECKQYLSSCTPLAFDSAFRKTCPNVIPFRSSGSVECDPYTTNFTVTLCPPHSQ